MNVLVEDIELILFDKIQIFRILFEFHHHHEKHQVERFQMKKKYSRQQPVVQKKEK